LNEVSMGFMKLGALLALTLWADPANDPAVDRLYGRVLTVDGDVLEGYLRWDRNEASWTDFLDASKEIPQEYLREAESLDPEYAAMRRRDRTIEAFGVRISWDVDDDEELPRATSGVRFGHIASITPIDNRHALLRLASGEEVRLRSSSTDLGRSMRPLVVEDVGGREVSVRWRELARVDFMSAPPGAAAPLSERLHGTVRTWGGLELTGFIAWDLDEILKSDVLDGREGREDLEIEFQDIASIAWESSRSSRIRLVSGEELVLRGSNDVDRSNRGIEVSDAGFGRARVPWGETVEAIDGRVLVGEIRWDNDEAAGWEMLDGWSNEVDLDIEFGAIDSIERGEGEGDGVTVTLGDGRTFDLVGSNDVDEGNKGIFVKPEGRARRLVRWRDFSRVVFER
jgi:hypothetical protein